MNQESPAFRYGECQVWTERNCRRAITSQKMVTARKDGQYAGLVEQADTADLKSAERNLVPVRIWSAAPH